jgi:hypothetical protein
MDGGQVLTDRRLSLYASWFEHRFREYPGVRSYRLSAGGLAIAGLENAATEQLLALPDRRDEINQRLETLFEGISREFKGDEAVRRRSEQYEKARSALIRGLEQICAEARDAAGLAENALRNYSAADAGRGSPPDEAGREKILKKLDRAFQAIKTSEVRDVAGFLFPPAEGESAGNTDKTDPFRQYLESTAKTCEALTGAVEYQLGALNQNFSKVSNP